MYRKLIYLLLLLLPVALGADFGVLNPIIEMEGDEYFYLDSEKGCSVQGEYLTYAILGINEETEESWLEVYRSDDGGETFESEELMNWDGLPETAEFDWYLTGENFYF